MPSSSGTRSMARAAFSPGNSGGIHPERSTLGVSSRMAGQEAYRWVRPLHYVGVPSASSLGRVGAGLQIPMQEHHTDPGGR
jgi:hypothetical protein